MKPTTRLHHIVLSSVLERGYTIIQRRVVVDTVEDTIPPVQPKLEEPNLREDR
jgi:hypothetical protein